MTYNIHRAIGANGRPSIRDIATVLAEARPDVVGLNEVVRTPIVADQPARLARALGMTHAFQRTTRRDGMAFGNAVLTRGRVIGRRDVALPDGPEPRALLLVDLEVDGLCFTFGATHLDPRPGPRTAQLDALPGAIPEDVPFVLAGDFNAGPWHLGQLRAYLDLAPPQATFPALDPRAAIDHVLFSKHWCCTGASALARPASDHAALVVDLELVAPGPLRATSSGGRLHLPRERSRPTGELFGGEDASLY